MAVVTMKELEDYLDERIAYWGGRFDDTGSNGALGASGALQNVREFINKGKPEKKKCPTCGRGHD